MGFASFSMLHTQGIVAVLPYMNKQVVSVSRDDLVIFLKEANPLFASLSPPTASKFSELGWQTHLKHTLIPDTFREHADYD